jgi:ribose/xylose/arabinose/galactoside ABC-type transport system permease subunit
MEENKSLGFSEVIKKFLNSEMFLALFLLIMLLFLRINAKDFFTANNIMSILNRFSYVLIAAIGMNIIILTSNIDVSAGALISVVCITIAAIGKMGANTGLIMIVAILVGGFLSFINGVIITRFKIPAIVATLATTQIFAGVLPLVVEGSIYDLPATFTWLAFDAKIFGIIPASVLIMLIITVFSLVFMKYSRFSKKLYAIGNNPHGARLAGVNVDKIVVLAYTIAGCLFGISGVIIATASQRVTTTMGTGLEMTFIAAVVLGGTSTAGGSGKLIGTVLGALILSIIAPAINYLGISSDWSDAIMGIIIIVAVVVGVIKFKQRKLITGGIA